jgi:hypothetical protein
LRRRDSNAGNFTSFKKDDRFPLTAVCLMWASTAAAVELIRWGTIDTALPRLERVPLPEGNMLRMWRVRG